MPPPVPSLNCHMWYWLPSGMGMESPNFQPKALTAHCLVAAGSALAISVCEMKPGRMARSMDAEAEAAFLAGLRAAGREAARLAVLRAGLRDVLRAAIGITGQGPGVHARSRL